MKTAEAVLGNLAGLLWGNWMLFVLLGLVHCGYKKIRQKAPSPIGMILLSAILGIVFWH